MPRELEFEFSVNIIILSFAPIEDVDEKNSVSEKDFELFIYADVDIALYPRTVGSDASVYLSKMVKEAKECIPSIAINIMEVDVAKTTKYKPNVGGLIWIQTFDKSFKEQ